jgi:hypothetical protein
MSVEIQKTKDERRKGWSFKLKFELFSIALMLTGVFMVCQPFFHTLFRYGFLVTLAGIIAFTVASNLRERHG